jgi:hypothetical protein
MSDACSQNCCQPNTDELGHTCWNLVMAALYQSRSRPLTGAGDEGREFGALVCSGLGVLKTRVMLPRPRVFPRALALEDESPRNAAPRPGPEISIHDMVYRLPCFYPTSASNVCAIIRASPNSALA